MEPVIYGPDGQPLKRNMVKQDLTREIAAPTVTGLRQVLGGHPEEGLTPQRLASLLKNAEMQDAERYLELAEAMEEKDLHYRSVLNTRKLQVSGLPLTVEAASEDARDIEIADAVRNVVTGDAVQDVIYDLLDAVAKGYSVAEIVWATEDGAWTPAEILHRDPRWFQFDPFDGRTLMLRDESGQLVPLATYKFIRHMHRSKTGTPIRGGLARAVAWGYLFKNFTIKDWVIFLERFGHPLRVGKYHSGATDEEKAALLRAVRNIATDAAAIVPEGMALEFIEAKITGNVDAFERKAAWWDKQTSKLILGQTGTTDVGQHTGTADAHERVREDIEADDARQLGATLNRDLVRPYVDLNFGRPKAYPKIVIYRAEQEDLKALAENLSKLVPLGLKVGMASVRDRFGFEDPDPDEELLGVAAPPSPPSPEIEDQAAIPALNARQETDARDAIERAADAAADDWEPLVDPMLAPVLELLDEVESMEEFNERLGEAILKMNTGPFAERLARLRFQATVAGELGIENLAED